MPHLCEWCEDYLADGVFRARDTEDTLSIRAWWLCPKCRVGAVEFVAVVQLVKG